MKTPRSFQFVCVFLPCLLAAQDQGMKTTLMTVDTSNVDGKFHILARKSAQTSADTIGGIKNLLKDMQSDSSRRKFKRELADGQLGTMRSDFDLYEALEGICRDRSEKAENWAYFLSKYTRDIPDDDRDDVLREKATNRVVLFTFLNSTRASGLSGPTTDISYTKLDSARSARKSGNYRESARLFSEAIDVGVLYPHTCYMAASCFATCGETDSALCYLDKLLGLRWRDLKRLQGDTSFNRIRDDTRWKGIEARLKYRLNKMADIDSVLDHLDDLGASVYQYYLRPKTLGGGGGSCLGYEIPWGRSVTKQASFECVSAADSSVILRAKSTRGSGEILARIGWEGKVDVQRVMGGFRSRIIAFSAGAYN